MKPGVIIVWCCDVNEIVPIQIVFRANKQLGVPVLGCEIVTRCLLHIPKGSIEISRCNSCEIAHLFWIERISTGQTRETNGQPTSLSPL